MAEEQKAKYEIIYDMGTELYIAKVQLAELKEQDINARIMKNEMQDQLTANIKNRGQLESLPLIALMGEKLEIISGHHRVKSAREAGLKEIIVILDKSGLTRSKAASKQLAHNAISGFDDESTLREIVKLDKDGNTKPAKIETVETEEDIIPDVGACCFWLKNRRPDIWRDKQEIGLYEIEDMEGIEADIYGGEE